ncbi:hypothetical protein DUI87_20086 [Hirundo rustica rustica]|uniref:Uncharacterized protein n=1 Tax=Hirundo rustica rustica TaxID=333673 RepID=A0A3M0JPI9_HIRRU|nr:hypothetical protein DUI87_20086 [Hirundo rustica rustica]
MLLETGPAEQTDLQRLQSSFQEDPTPAGTAAGYSQPEDGNTQFWTEGGRKKDRSKEEEALLIPPPYIPPQNPQIPDAPPIEPHEAESNPEPPRGSQRCATSVLSCEVPCIAQITCLVGTLPSSPSSLPDDVLPSWGDSACKLPGLPVTARHPHVDMCHGRMWVEMEAQPNYRVKNAAGNA